MSREIQGTIHQVADVGDGTKMVVMFVPDCPAKRGDGVILTINEG